MSTIHNPKNFIPENYVVVDYLDNRGPAADEYFYIYRADAATQMFDIARDRFNADFAKYFGMRDTVNGRANVPYTCVHCGSAIRYVAVAHYAPADKFVAMGTECANRCDLTTDEHKIKNLKDVARKRAKTMALGSKYARYMDEHKELAAMVADYTAAKIENGFIDSVLRNLHQYGDMTPAQYEGVMKAIPRSIEAVAKREEREHAESEKRDALIASGVTMLEGRREIEGEVASTKIVDSDYGSTLKMLVIDDDGFKYWGTVPSSVDVNRGDRVNLTATVTVSNDDPLFGWYKRPAKATVTHKEA